MDSRKGGAPDCVLKMARCVATLALGLILLFSSVSSWGQEGRKLIKKVDPVYPELARRINLTGTVKVEISIGADGVVNEVRTLGGNPVLVAAVEDAVKQWKYASGASEIKKLEFRF
jgi:TonB family protein